MTQETTLAKLLEGWLDGGMPEAEENALLRQLETDPELRRRFAEQVATLGATRAAMDANPRWLALFDLLDREDDSEGPARSFEAATMGRIASTRRRSWHSPPGILALAAAVALLLTGTFLLMPRQAEPAGETLADKAPETPDVSRKVAVVTGGSPDCGFEPGVYLNPGVIARNDGWISLQTMKGVAVTLDAPFEVVLSDHDRILLKKGRARVRVPDGAEGFRLESPAFEILDLGTEFATRVNADGTGTCRVFEGKADVMLLDTMKETKETRRVNASESVLINPSNQVMQMIEEKDDDYPVLKQSPRRTLRLAPQYPAGVMAMGPMEYWRFETLKSGHVPSEVPDGVNLVAVGSASISAEEGDNHSGDLTQFQQTGYFKIPGAGKTRFEGDFTIGFFTQLSWLQNFALISSMRFDAQRKGHSFILQCYASLGKIGIDGSALHAVFRDPPSWDGGSDLVGGAPLSPLQWQHIAITREDGIATIYLDGKVIARETVGTMPLDCREIFVGRLNGNAGQPRAEAREMVGHIDELVIFQRALTSAEIRTLSLTEN